MLFAFEKEALDISEGGKQELFSFLFSMCQVKRRTFKEDQLELAGVTKVGMYGT